jgi:hypothetical protein
VASNLPVPITQGGDAGGDETVNLALSNPDGGATLSSHSNAVITFIDNDQVPEVNCGGGCPIVGTDRAEHIDGTADADVIDALAGGDMIAGWAAATA